MRDDLHCIELVARLGEYMEGALSPEERRRFEIHIDACRGCDRFSSQIGWVRAALGRTVFLADAGDYSPKLSALFSDWMRSREPRLD